MSTSIDKIENKRAKDPLDHLIFEGGLRIKELWFDKELDLIIVLLNNKKIIKRPISNFPLLLNASLDQLNNYENDGIGVHWHELDEDLSLRGFLKYELAHMEEPVVV